MGQPGKRCGHRHGRGWLPSLGASWVRLGGLILSRCDLNIQKPGTESQASSSVGWYVAWDLLKYQGN